VKSRRAIVRAAIHPAIGIARVGDSPKGYFFGPEVPHPPRRPAGSYKDKNGFLKRQAVRFRIFGYDCAGNVVRELTLSNAEIEWRVHVANKKGAWYQFRAAMDIPEAISSPRRNATLTGDARKDLVIDPGPLNISGKKRIGPKYYLDTGTFLGDRVYLGELRTDDFGRLIFLGGHGRSATPRKNNTALDFANNDGWYDDTSDGPVSASVIVDEKEIPVDSAWVVVAPPNYAPNVISMKTMYDVMVDAYQGWGFNSPAEVSFTNDICPIFERLSQAQWVNKGFQVQFGWRGAYDFLHPEHIAKLSNPGVENQELRRQLFNSFRNPDYRTIDPYRWPQIYGDNFNVPMVDARQFLAVTSTQYFLLKQWRDGNFKSDWNPAQRRPDNIESVSLQDRPAVLDRTSLEHCMGGPFHPGCEMTWPMRHAKLYRAPFRIRLRTADNPEPDYGDVLTPAVIQDSNSNDNPDGPLAASGPGDITRWLAVPWQTDTASCRAGYEPEYDPYLPTFWPAGVPNHVLAAKDYADVMNQKLPLDERVRAFYRRSTWFRVLKGGEIDQINQMINDFSKLGVVEERPGPQDHEFPPTMLVESPPAMGLRAPHDRNNVMKRSPRGHLATAHRV
jgi:hypothetical protein